MSDLDLPEAHGRALDSTGRIVSAMAGADLDGPTPCAGWSLRDLLNHVVAGNWWAAELVAGRTIEEVGARFDGDIVGSDPAGEYIRSAAAAAAAFGATGAMDAPCAVSYGPVPGSVYCGHRLIDVLIHGWDIAVATGQPTAIDPVLVDAAWQVLEPQLDLLQGSGMFGDPQPVGPDATAEQRLLAALGRH